jgi:hypothetical protein
LQLFFTGAEYLELIFEYAGWVIKESSEDGLRVSKKLAGIQFVIFVKKPLCHV